MQFHTISCQTSVLSARWTCLPGQFADNSGRKGGVVFKHLRQRLSVLVTRDNMANGREVFLMLPLDFIIFKFEYWDIQI